MLCEIIIKKKVGHRFAGHFNRWELEKREKSEAIASDAVSGSITFGKKKKTAKNV